MAECFKDGCKGTIVVHPLLPDTSNCNICQCVYSLSRILRALDERDADVERYITGYEKVHARMRNDIDVLHVWISKAPYGAQLVATWGDWLKSRPIVMTSATVDALAPIVKKMVDDVSSSD